MLKQAYLDELNKIVKESSNAAYVILRFKPLTTYAILDTEITTEEYYEVIAKAKEFIDFLASE